MTSSISEAERIDADAVTRFQPPKQGNYLVELVAQICPDVQKKGQKPKLMFKEALLVYLPFLQPPRPGVILLLSGDTIILKTVNGTEQPIGRFNYIVV